MSKIILIIMLFCLPKLMAQQTVNPSGGNASGSGGSSSYSVGQIAFKTQTGTNGTVNQGVIQPIEIFTLSGEAFTNIMLEAVVYPNPTTSNISLKISNFISDAFSYQIFDIQGKMLGNGEISNEETILDMNIYPAAIYILKVNSNSKELKTFKIIKK